MPMGRRRAGLSAIGVTGCLLPTAIWPPEPPKETKPQRCCARKPQTEPSPERRVRIRSHPKPVTVERAASPISVAGAIVRYGFYLVGALALGLIGMAVVSVWRMVPAAVDAPPAFRLAAPGLAHLPATGHVVRSSRFGRIEVRQYGRLHNRDVDLAILLAMPPKGIGMGTEFAQDLREVNVLRHARGV